MTNLAANPNAWQNESGVSPPSWWTGTAYVCDDTGRLGIGAVMTLIAAPNAGDTFEVTFQNFAAPNPVGTSSDVSLYDSNGNQLATWDLTSPNGPSDSTYTFDGTEGLAYLQAETVVSGTPHTTYQADFSFTPLSPQPPDVPDLSVKISNESQGTTITPQVTLDGVPVQGYTLAVVTQPTQGTVVINDEGNAFIYTPTLGTTLVPDSFTYTSTYNGSASSAAGTVNIFIFTQYNCSCDAASDVETNGPGFPTETLAQLERRVLVRLGYAAQATPPPGMAELIDGFLHDAQKEMYRMYECFRTRRWFTWQMMQGIRFYDWHEDIENLAMLITAPSIGVTAATTGGTVPAGQTTYAVTAVNDNGETTPSVSVTVTNTGSTSANTVTWPLVAGASSYNVYVMAPNGPLGQQQLSLLASVNNALSYVDTVGTTTNTQVAPDINTTAVCSKFLDPRRIEWVGISRGDNVWQPLYEGIDPVMYTSKIQAIPQRYEIRSCIEIWPAPSDNTWQLRIKGDFGLLPFTQPRDVTTIDPHVVFLKAVADAKAYYQQPDATRYDSLLQLYITKIQAGTNSNHRAWPGRGVVMNAIPPKMTPR